MAIQPLNTQTETAVDPGTLITLKTWKESKTTNVLGITTGEDALMVSEYETTLPNASVPVINQDRRLWLEALADFHGEGIVPRENISIRTLIAPSPEHKKWLDQRYLFISTPSHGYVKVHSSVLGMIGILDEFSAYSPTHGGYRFLEEDCDAYKFICALADALGKTRHDVMEENLDYVEQQELP